MWIRSSAGPAEPVKVERVALVGPLANRVEQTAGGFTGVVLLPVRFPFAIAVDQRGGCRLVFHRSSWTSHAMPSLPSLFLCHDIAYLSCDVAYFLTSHHLPSLAASLTSSLPIILSSRSVTYLLIFHYFSLSFPPSHSPHLNHLRSLLI